MSSVVEESPFRLLQETNKLYSVLHAGEPQPEMPSDAEGNVFILGHVATVTKNMLLALGVTDVAEDGMPVMRRIRSHVNGLSAELVGREIADDAERVTLVELIEHMEKLNNSVNRKRSECSIM